MHNDKNLIDRLLDIALEEDIANGDITSTLIIPQKTKVSAQMKMKADGVISGLAVAKLVFERMDPEVEWKPKVKDGDLVRCGDVILELNGNYQSLLEGERLALNVLQRMSGIATETSKYVSALDGTNTQILDTRKTVPGWRILDKMAVKHGGGKNHRMGLYDMVMIKDNHIKAAGSITEAIKAIISNLPTSVKIEVETSSLEEVQEALNFPIDVIMLDNMDTETMSKAVRMVNGRCKTEASGNMNLERVREVAETGVDFISVGALTHSVKALDISMNFIL